MKQHHRTILVAALLLFAIYAVIYDIIDFSLMTTVERKIK